MSEEEVMGWQIKIWHEDVDDRTRLVIEAGPEIPDEVISSVAGSYWLEEVQLSVDDWDLTDALDDAMEDPGPRLQG